MIRTSHLATHLPGVLLDTKRAWSKLPRSADTRQLAPDALREYPVATRHRRLTDDVVQR